MRLLVTGAAGGLGRAFIGGIGSNHDVHAFARGSLDIGDRDAVMRIVAQVAPDAIVNCAAFTNVDACERDRRKAFRVNASGPGHLAIAAEACGATLLHISTDYVFDGRDAPYDEKDLPVPLSVYGRSKLAGEIAVRRATNKHVIVRTGYVFGSGTDYFSGALARLRRGETVGGLIDRFGSPTHVRFLADRLMPILASGHLGTIHLAGRTRACWHDVLRLAQARHSLPGTVVAQAADDLMLAARRPVDSSLTSLYLDHLDVPPMPSLAEAIDDITVSRVASTRSGTETRDGSHPAVC